VLEDGRLELEPYDFSDKAEETYGNDVATRDRNWSSACKNALARPLGTTLLEALARHFEDSHGITGWLEHKGIRCDRMVLDRCPYFVE
jgi:hypothetical protein